LHGEEKAAWRAALRIRAPVPLFWFDKSGKQGERGVDRVSQWW